MVHLGDIRNIDVSKIETVDCIIGGSPCQDLSVAGNRIGLSGNRSGLFMEQLRIVREMRAFDNRNGNKKWDEIKPRVMVWENVKGAFTSNSGKDFQKVLTEIIRIVEPNCPDVPMPKSGKWQYSGYLYDGVGGRFSLAWRLHDSQYWGVPQRRERLSIVADFGGLSAAEVLFECKVMPRDSDESRDERQDSAGNTRKSIKKADIGKCLNPWDVQSKHIQPINGIAEALYSGECRYGGSESYVLIKKPKSHELTICIEGNGTRQSHHGDGYKESDVMYTLNTVEQHALAYNTNDDYIVRHLTPKEYERLQAFPDDWTNIGEWVDSKGKQHKCSDSARYKALGNSIAIPFWDWLIGRISKIYGHTPTLGSLFDGIGGFPLCWERHNGKGTARWASEIEEFPMAVTKLRFPETE